MCYRIGCQQAVLKILPLLYHRHFAAVAELRLWKQKAADDNAAVQPKVTEYLAKLVALALPAALERATRHADVSW
jgi:hypothetical protein